MKPYFSVVVAYSRRVVFPKAPSLALFCSLFTFFQLDMLSKCYFHVMSIVISCFTMSQSTPSDCQTGLFGQFLNPSSRLNAWICSSPGELSSTLINFDMKISAVALQHSVMTVLNKRITFTSRIKCQGGVNWLVQRKQDGARRANVIDSCLHVCG